ncbi:hypothetical protein [Roseimicrobium sp. ORNL1]|uniref:nSTAND1 domain-containing NTPase n=1 Tax=Roseimicrobium sp. ORNL1 TaxID=2711231 RepID=UPI0013E1EF37|nr:hypothetical protein [Roseimicrobium sp. ORNL1]QIF02430.1 hypothetical protein G5S37_13150 [Roseimicrobium sp. ORNL1]
MSDLYTTIKHLVGVVDDPTGDSRMLGFLKRLYVASFDLDQDASQDKSRTLVMLSLALSGTPEAAAMCWNAVFDFISSNSGKAKHINEEDLRRLGAEQGVELEIDRLRELRLAKLRRHCGVTRGQIEPRLRVTNMHLERRLLLEEIQRCLNESRVVLVRGAAGSGKSAAALQAAEECAGCAQTFCFRAEEFLYVHLDTALHAAGLSETAWDEWTALLPGAVAVVLVDGVERLLQREESREAFADLLRTLQNQVQWKLLLTCRESFAETLTYELLGFGVSAALVNVPKLEETELDQALAGTTLARVVERNTGLRHYLTNLKWLDLSLSALQGLPEQSTATWSTESAWRKHVWRRLVWEKNGARRERCLVHVSRARLQVASGWVEVPESLFDVAESLVADGLLRKAGTQFTTAHDLLEDWTLLTYLDQVAVTAQSSMRAMIDEVGDLPLMRTCFRSWLGEQLDNGHPDALRWLEAALSASNGHERWREEALLSLLGAREALAILKATKTHWLAEDGRLFADLQRSLQMAYVTMEVHPDCRRPRGPGWAAVLDFAALENRAWLLQQLATVSKVLMGWKGAVTQICPQPSGLQAAGRILQVIWEEVTERRLDFTELIAFPDSYLHDDKDPLVQLISTVAATFPTSFFEALSEEGDDVDESRWRYSVLADRVLTCVTGTCLSYHLSRAQPELVMRLFRKHWGLTPSIRRARRDQYSNERGLLGNRHFRGSSAFVGPFLAMLRHHQSHGIAFQLEFLNFCIQEERDSGGDGIDELELFEFTIDGRSFSQWGHQGWWRAYRGHSPQHHLEESALMALEKWLLEEVSSRDELETICLNLMQNCQNLGLTAVVSSVAMAFSRKFMTFPLLVLQQPRLFSLDRRRYFNDQSNRMLRDSDDLPYEALQERKEADGLPHRDTQLEHYIIEAQFGPAQESIQNALSGHSRALAAIDVEELTPQTTDELNTLRLLIHRIDTRNLSAQPLNDGTGRIALVTAQLPEDLDVIVKEADESYSTYAQVQSAFLWASQMFDEYRTADRSRWKEMLRAVQHMMPKDPNAELLFGAVPAQIAAACVTFCWDEMSQEQLTWCCETLADCLGKEESVTTWSGRGVPVVRGMGFAHVAHGVGVVCGKLDSDHPLKLSFLERCAIGLSHPEKNVAESTAAGLASVIDMVVAQKLQLAAAALMFGHARAEHEVNYKFRGPNGPPDLNWEERRDAMHAELLGRVRTLRRSFVNGESVNVASLERVFIKGFMGHQRLASTLRLLVHHDTNVARRVFKRASKWLFCAWADGTSRRSRRRRNDELHLVGRDARNAVTVGEASRTIALRALSMPNEGEQLMRQLTRRLRIAYLGMNTREILGELVFAADACGAREAFWKLWRECRDAARLLGHFLGSEDKWVHLGVPEQTALEAYHSLLSALFFNGMHFRENDSWEPLEGHKDEVQEAFVLMGPIALTRFVRFLSILGGSLLPQAWERLAESIAQLQGRISLSVVVTPSIHPILLRLIQGEISQQRIPQQNHQSWSFIQEILDVLVNQGSPEAFHLRETMTRRKLRPA